LKTSSMRLLGVSCVFSGLIVNFMVELLCTVLGGKQEVFGSLAELQPGVHYQNL
jgi:hypothetical protein